MRLGILQTARALGDLVLERLPRHGPAPAKACEPKTSENNDRDEQLDDLLKPCLLLAHAHGFERLGPTFCGVLDHHLTDLMD